MFLSRSGAPATSETPGRLAHWAALAEDLLRARLAASNVAFLPRGGGLARPGSLLHVPCGPGAGARVWREERFGHSPGGQALAGFARGWTNIAADSCAGREDSED